MGWCHLAAAGGRAIASPLHTAHLCRPSPCCARARRPRAGLGFGFSQFGLFAIYALAFWYAGQLVLRGENTFEEVLKVRRQTG